MSSSDASEMLVVTELNGTLLGISATYVEEIIKIKSFYRSPFHDVPLLGIHLRNDNTLMPLFDLNHLIFSSRLMEVPKTAEISLEPKGMECLVVNMKDGKIGLMCNQVKSVIPKSELTVIDTEELTEKINSSLNPECIKDVLKDQKSNDIIVEIELSKILPVEGPEIKSESQLNEDEDDEDFDISQYTLPSE